MLNKSQFLFSLTIVIILALKNAQGKLNNFQGINNNHQLGNLNLDF